MANMIETPTFLPEAPVPSQSQPEDDFAAYNDMQSSGATERSEFIVPPLSGKADTDKPADKPASRFTAGQVFGAAAATGLLGLGAGAGLALTAENSLTHSEPTVEQLHTEALSSMTIFPSPKYGDLQSSVEEGVADLTSKVTREEDGEQKTFITIDHDRIVSESQTASQEYSRISNGRSVDQSTPFKLYLLQKEDGSFDIEVNPERNNER